MKNKLDLFFSSFGSNEGFVKAYKQSKSISLLKLIFPLIACVLISIFSWFIFFSVPNKADLMILTSAKEMSKSLVMRAPKVEGYTTNNRLYTVTAVRAFQDFRHADFIELEDLKGVFPFGHADQAFFNAKKGFLNRINRQMFFHGPLMVKTSDGMVTHLLSAHMNLATIQLETKERVEMSDGRKFLTANCMRVFDNGDKIIFNGGVRFMMILSHER